MDEKKLAKIRKNNMKLYPIYKMVGLDWIFYYGVRVLFLTQVKGISPADIILSGTVYSLCYVLFQVPNTLLLDIIGKRNAVVLGQLLNLISMFIIMLCPNYECLLLSQVICALGFGIKGIAESNLLDVSLPKTTKKGNIFSKIDGGGYSKFCYIGATSVVISGFLYAINPYIPIVLCLFFNLLAFIIATNFIDIEKVQNKKEKIDIKADAKNILKDTKEGFLFIFHSKRLRALLLMLGLLWGIINNYATYQETLLKEMNLPSYYIGFILAGFQMLVGVFATKSIAFNKKHGNKTLTYIGIILTIGSIMLGIATILNIPFAIQIIVVILVFVLRAYAKGIYQVIKKRYMGNFSNSKILPKIYSINNMMANLGNVIIGLMCSSILKLADLPYALLIVGATCAILVIIASLYTKSRLGLKPEEYKKEDIGICVE